MREKINIHIWADLICPWCWIGKTRLEKALATSSLSESFTLVHRSYRLAPNSPVQPVEKALAEKLHRSSEDVIKMMTHVEKVAAGDRLKYHLEGTLYGDTSDGHRLVLWAAGKGLQSEVLSRFYRAYFSENISLFDRNRMLDLVASLGLDRTEASTMLETDAFKKEIEADEAEARHYGSSGVPFFIFDEKYALSGAQPVETFSQVLAKVFSELPR